VVCVCILFCEYFFYAFWVETARRGPFGSTDWTCVDQDTDIRYVWILFEEMMADKVGSKYARFAYLCLDLLRKPAGNGGVERTFNPVRLIHTWARNRLSKEKLDMLIYIYINERMLVRIKQRKSLTKEDLRPLL